MTSALDEHQRRQELITRARLVAGAWDELKPLIESRKNAAHSGLLNAFRNGSPPEMFVRYVATLNEIAELEQEVATVVNRAKFKQKESLDA